MWGCDTEGVDAWERARWKRVAEHGRAATVWREEQRRAQREGEMVGMLSPEVEETVVAALGCWVGGTVLGVATISRDGGDGACARRRRVKRGEAGGVVAAIQRQGLGSVYGVGRKRYE